MSGQGVIEIFGNNITSRFRCEIYEGNILMILALLFRDAQAIIFVIDSSDKLTLLVAKDELNLLLGTTVRNERLLVGDYYVDLSFLYEASK